MRKDALKIHRELAYLRAVGRVRATRRKGRKAREQADRYLAIRRAKLTKLEKQA